MELDSAYMLMRLKMTLNNTESRIKPHWNTHTIVHKNKIYKNWL